jgi:hypothetical protein
VRTTISRLRENIYRLLDHVLETGEPIEIERKGRLLRITRAGEEQNVRLARLVPHPGAILGDPEDLVHVDWSSEWRP